MLDAVKLIHHWQAIKTREAAARATEALNHHKWFMHAVDNSDLAKNAFGLKKALWKDVVQKERAAWMASIKRELVFAEVKNDNMPLRVASFVFSVRIRIIYIYTYLWTNSELSNQPPTRRLPTIPFCTREHAPSGPSRLFEPRSCLRKLPCVPY